MKGNDFIKRLRAIAKAKCVEVRIDKKRGKGSHQTIYFGERKTVIRNPKDELKTGTCRAMLNQLGINKDDF